MYKVKHFHVVELFSKNMCNKYIDFDEEKFLLSLMDVRILYIADCIREYFNKPMIINNWKFDGDFNYRGFREKECKEGVEYSQHRYGRAIDFNIKDLDCNEIRSTIVLKHKEGLDGFKLIKRMEKSGNWVHIDVANTITDGLVIF